MRNLSTKFYCIFCGKEIYVKDWHRTYTYDPLEGEAHCKNCGQDFYIENRGSRPGEVQITLL